MPVWIPEAKWKDKDVFIIGGGASLEKFDWKLLENELTIGCNSAFEKGEKICKICVFGDAKFFRAYQKELQKYKGVVFTNASQYYRNKISWLWVLPRKARGLGVNHLGWNMNTGAVAVNLALILGAKRVFLLGFDMHLSKEGKSNYHNKGLDKPNKKVYERFIRGFTDLSIDMKKVFPDREIINITDDSNLDLFPKISCNKFWNERKIHGLD